jgi:hypothetical protein
MTVSESQSPGGHFALKFILRGTGVLLALGSALFVTGIAVAVLTNAFPQAGSQYLMILSRIGVLALIGTIFALFAKVGFDMLRKVDTTAVENFAFIFAALSARVLYSAGSWGCKYWARHVNESGTLPISLPSLRTPEILWCLAFLSFFIFRRVYFSALMGVLELNPKYPTAPPSIGDDSSIPEFPEKSPLIELR